jgi:hypothetical protein
VREARGAAGENWQNKRVFLNATSLVWQLKLILINLNSHSAHENIFHSPHCEVDPFSACYFPCTLTLRSLGRPKMDCAKYVWVVEDSSDSEPEEGVDERTTDEQFPSVGPIDAFSKGEEGRRRPGEQLDQTRPRTACHTSSIADSRVAGGFEDKTCDKPCFLIDSRMADMVLGSSQGIRQGPVFAKLQESSEFDRSHTANPTLQSEVSLAASGAISSPAPVTPTEIKDRLRDHFRDIYTESSLACYEPLEDAPNPGLTIDGVGDISFPLSRRDIMRIQIASKGPRFVEFYDREVRISPQSPNGPLGWEIPGIMWQTTNPAWNSLLQSVCDKVEEELGIMNFRKGIMLEQCCLILYGVGSRIAQSNIP